MSPACLDGLRYRAWTSGDAPPELHRLLAQMDEFLLRSGGRDLAALETGTGNPFLAAVSDAMGQCQFTQGLAVGRWDLATQAFGLTAMTGPQDNPPHRAAMPTPQRPDPRAEEGQPSYRARPVRSFFDEPTTVRDLVNSVAGELGAWIDVDLASLVTAKASGFMIKQTQGGSYVRPWGGHCASYLEAQHLGVLEGLERIGAEAPRGVTFPEPPPGIRALSPADFGLADDDWLAPPQIRHWTLGHSLSTGEAVVIPTRLVYFHPAIDEHYWVQESSNGCAIGGSDDEAQLFGLLEAIERDAFLASWYAALPLSEIDPRTITDPRCVNYLARLTLCGQEVRFLDATVGVPIPTVIAVCTDGEGVSCVGAGSHPNVCRALTSALVEVASDFQVVAAHRRDREPELAEMLSDYGAVRVMEDHADMFAHPGARPLLAPWLDSDHDLVSLEHLKRPGAGASVADDLAACVAACAEAGFDPIAVETQPRAAESIGARCWKVVVPGLIPIDFGFGYQRALRMPRLAEVADDFTARTGRAPARFPYPVPHPFP